MKKGGFVMVALVTIMGLGGLSLGTYAWSVSHVRRWTGRHDLNFVTCNHCHLVSLEKMPWAKPRPHHSAPASVAVSPDGQRVYIALDDVDEVVEADVISRKVVRRLKVEGAPFGLALDSQGMPPPSCDISMPRPVRRGRR